MVKSRVAYYLLVLGCCLLPVAGWPSAAEAADRDEEIIERLVRLETTVERGFANLQRQIDDVNKNLQRRIDDVNNNLQRQIDDVRSEVRWIGGILFTGMFVVVGFVLWDRRTALAPVVKKNEEIEKRNEELETRLAQLEKAIKQYALKKEPDMVEELREAGLLSAAKV